MTEVQAKGPDFGTARKVPEGPDFATARAIKPQQPQDFLGAATNVLAGISHDFIAGLQGTSPDLSIYEPAGEVVELDTGPTIMKDGKQIILDPKHHVVFRDPESGKIMAYNRNPDAEEPIASFGRVLGLGAIVGPVARSASSATKGAASVADDFARHGIEAGLAQRSTSRTLGAAQNALREVPVASNIIEKSEKGVLEGTARAVDEVAGKFGPGNSLEDAGRAVRAGAEKFLEGTGEVAESDLLKVPTRRGGFDEKSKALYGRLDSFFKEGDTVDVSRSLDALTQPPSKFENTALAQAFVDDKLKPFADAIKGATNGQLSFSDLKAFRTEVGRKLRKPSILSDIDQDQLINLYGALSDDMRAAAAAKGDGALRAFERANTYFRAGMNRIKTTLATALKEIDKAPPEKVAGEIQTIASAGKRTANIDKLRKLRKSIPEDEWKIVSSSLLREMGRPVASASDAVQKVDFSPASFLTRWEGLSKKAKTELFSTAGNHELRQELDSLVRVISAEKGLGKLSNPSGTARVLITGAAGGGMLHDPVTTILTGVSAVSAAYLLTSPKPVKALAALASAGNKVPMRSATLHFARLRHAVKGAPQVEAEVQRLLSPVLSDTQERNEGRATAAEQQ
ncbi:MAG: hypothetical protein NXI13_16445 [Proteobacteria bacterium]|nr:hypothetical protein [Pseudomonadota bacterium]